MRAIWATALALAILSASASSTWARVPPPLVQTRAFYASFGLFTRADEAMLEGTDLQAAGLTEEPTRLDVHAAAIARAGSCPRPRPGVYRCRVTLRYWWDGSDAAGHEAHSARGRCDTPVIATRRSWRFPPELFTCPPEFLP